MDNEIINILNNLMKYKTIKENKREFERVFNYIKSIVPSNLFLSEYEFRGNKAIVISNTLDKELDIAFCTHIDVVPSDNYDMKIEGDKIFGRGTIDMKGNVAVLLNLFINVITNKKMALFITSDEEVDGYSAMKLLEIYQPKLGIVPDGGDNFDLIVEEKGLLQLKLVVKTKSAHAAEPYKGVNAILKLMNVYKKLIKKYPLPKNDDDYVSSINLSKMNGGDANNKVPSYAEMILDIRHTSSEDKEDFINCIKNIDNEIDIEVIGSGSLFKTDFTEEIRRYIYICEKILKRKINIKACSSTSDAIYFSNLNIPTIIMNPEGGNAHCINEYVTISGLINLYKIYLEFIK